MDGVPENQPQVFKFTNQVLKLKDLILPGLESGEFCRARLLAHDVIVIVIVPIVPIVPKHLLPRRADGGLNNDILFRVPKPDGRCVVGWMCGVVGWGGCVMGWAGGWAGWD